MTFDELIEKSLMELRDLAKDQNIPNIKKLRKNELASILAGEKAAPVPGKRGRKPKVRPEAAEQQNDTAAKQQEEIRLDSSSFTPSQPVTQETTPIFISTPSEENKIEIKTEEQPVAPRKRRGRPPKAKPVAIPETVAVEEPVVVVAESKVEAPPAQAPVQEEETSQPSSQPAQQEHPVMGEGEKRDNGYVPRFVNRDNNRFNNKPRYNNNGYVPRNQQKQGNYSSRRYENGEGGYNNNRRYENNDNGYNNRRYAPANNAGQEERAPRAPRQAVPVQEQNGEQTPEQETIQQPYYNEEYGTSNPAVPRMLENEDCPHVAGILEIMSEGYGFLRVNNYYSSPKDIYLSITQIRRFALRCGDFVEGRARPHREGDKFDALMYIDRVNGMAPDDNARRICFEDLVPIFPNERYTLEIPGKKNELSVRLIDLIAPIGKGQRAMIVSQPKAGKTTLLKQIAAGISTNYPEAHLMVLLIDERPEEVTDMKRCIQGEVIYSTFDELPEHHTRIAEMVQERAMRLVEQGEDVVILLDSLTRLARAYNLVIPPTGRTLSGGMDPGALHKPKRFFGAARNIEGGGSLTVIATALVETGSRMDDIVYEEFKGTGNMEVHLDRKLSEKRVFPAIDIYKSGTRRDDLLLSKKELDGVYMLRKFMAGGATTDVTEQVIPMLQRTSNNDEFIAKIKDWIKIYENKGYSVTGAQNRYGQ